MDHTVGNFRLQTQAANTKKNFPY